MAIAKGKGRLRGKQPKLSSAKRRHLLAVHAAGTHTQTELAELFVHPGPPSTANSNALNRLRIVDQEPDIMLL